MDIIKRVFFSLLPVRERRGGGRERGRGRFKSQRLERGTQHVYWQLNSRNQRVTLPVLSNINILDDEGFPNMLRKEPDHFVRRKG